MCPRKLTIDEKKRMYATKTFLLENLDKPLPVLFLAQRTALGVQRFKDGFFDLFDMPVTAYIHEARMQLGFFLLQHTDKPIKEIAFITGYQHTKNFLRAYKGFFGVTAGSIRKRQ